MPRVVDTACNLKEAAVGNAEVEVGDSPKSQIEIFNGKVRH